MIPMIRLKITKKMSPKIIPIGKIWKSESNGWVYHRGGYPLLYVAERIMVFNQR